MREITYCEAVREALDQEMDRDRSVFVMGEDIGLYGGAFGVSRGLLAKHGPGRVIQTPISENSFVGFGVGAALTGMRPVVEIMFMDFITLAMDQIVNHAAKLRYMYGGQARVPLVIRTPAGGGKAYGASHSQCLEGWFLHVPGLRVVAPSNPYDAKGLLTEAIRSDGPVIFVEHKLLYPVRGRVPEKGYTVPLGRARVVREGTDVTIVSYSMMLLEALKAAETLDAGGISAEVVDLVTLNPLDAETVLGSVKKTGRLVVVEEGHKTGGVGAEVAAMAAEGAIEYLDAPVLRIAAPDAPIPFSSVLEDEYIPDSGAIHAGVVGLLSRSI